MKAVILAGGLGTRISEESVTKPKPMVEIGGRPILWHILKIYSAHGINDFIICLGYKGYLIKEYFLNYSLHMSDITVDIASGDVTVHETSAEPWKITLVDTGERTMTGGRIRRIAKYLDGKDFCCTYGDGVSDVNIAKLIAFHRQMGTLATMTAVQPPGRFGAISMSDNKVTHFEEKPTGDGGWVNGGFFVLSPKVLDYIEGDHTVWERDPMENLASEGQLASYLHHGYWQPMDTLRDKNQLEELWTSGKAKWAIWK